MKRGVNYAQRMLMAIAAAMLMPGCVSERPGYYEGSTDGNFVSMNAQKMLGEQCYFEIPQNGIVTEFSDDLSVAAALLVEYERDSQGFRWEKPGTITVQFIARDNIRLTSNIANMSVDGAPNEAVEMRTETRSAKAETRSPYSIFFKRRDYLKAEQQLALMTVTMPLDEKRVKRLDLQLPDVKVGGTTTAPPAITFERRAGVEQNQICSEF